METIDTLKFFGALLFVTGLILMLAYLLRRFQIGQRLMNAGNPERRLRVTEVTAIDPRHRLVLIQRDEIEHLVLIGQDHSMLVESGIIRKTPADKPKMKKSKTGENA